MKLKVTTETGSYYHINTETERWIKNSNPYDRHGALMFLRVGDYEDRVPHAFEGGGSWEEADIPEVGKCMYIHGRGIHDWYVSTPVVSIEENPEDWDPYLDME